MSNTLVLYGGEQGEGSTAPSTHLGQSDVQRSSVCCMHVAAATARQRKHNSSASGAHQKAESWGAQASAQWCCLLSMYLGCAQVIVIVWNKLPATAEPTA